jgi:hypothetical protein
MLETYSNKRAREASESCQSPRHHSRIAHLCTHLQRYGYYGAICKVGYNIYIEKFNFQIEYKKKNAVAS